MPQLLFWKYFLFGLIGFFLGRLSMAIEYALLKGIAAQKKKSMESKLEGKTDKISLEGIHK